MTNQESSSNPTTATATATTTTTAGLIISKTEILQSFLTTSATNTHLSQDLRQIAASLSHNHSSVPYRSLRSIWSASDPLTRPDLSALLAGSQFVLTSPKPRQKSEELKARLRKFEEAAERKAYKEMVKDITPQRDESEPFSSYKDQIGFGLHVALTMFTGYLVGYYTFRALFGHNVVMHAAGGILGLVVGMLVETLLFIIRASNQDRDRKTTFTASKIKKNQ
ncbi:putative ATPase, vacuolar ER assembly factor, Vma12 [Helianthus annuus]|nr:putative ATPase, vacuolar ER assembly factor, Vma12 [Helianthus annuus]